MGIGNHKPCQEDEADDLFDSPSSSKAKPDKDTGMASQPLSLQVQQHNHDNSPAIDSISTSTSTSAHRNVSVHSNTERLPVRAAPPAKLQDLRELLWRRFGFGLGAYTCTLAPLALQEDTPLVMQTVFEWCKVMLHLLAIC